MQQRLPSVLSPPLAFAHRGARSVAPENTVEAFALGLRLGANGLETDAWLTADDHVVLDHDGVVRRRGRKVPIALLNLDELPGHIPTLGSLFEVCGNDFDLSVDLKDPRTFGPVIRESRTRGLGTDRLWLCHTDLTVLEEFRRHDDSAQLVESRRLKSLKEGPEVHCARLAESGVTVLNMPVTDWTGGLVTMAHRFGLLAFGWDAQLQRVLSTGLRMGLDAVYSDHVDVMVDVYSTEIGHQPRPRVSEE